MAFLRFLTGAQGTYKIAILSPLPLLSVLFQTYLVEAQTSVQNYRLTSLAPTSRFAENIAATEDSIRFFGPSPADQRVAIGAQGESIGISNSVGAVYVTTVDGITGTAGGASTNLLSYSGSAGMEFYGAAVQTVKSPLSVTSDILAIGAPGFKVGTQLFGKVEFKDSFNFGNLDGAITGPNINGGFGKYLSQPHRAIWSVTRGPLPELLVSAYNERRVYFLNLSNGYSALNTTKYVSFPATIPAGMAIPSSMFGIKAVTMDIVGDATEDLIICDPTARLNPTSSPNGIAYIYDGAAVTDYLSGTLTDLYPTSQIAPNTATLIQVNNQSLRFCNDAAVVEDSSGARVIAIGVSQSRAASSSSFFGYEGAVVAYKKGTGNTPTEIGTSFGGIEGVHFGYRVATLKASSLVVGAPKQSSSFAVLASVKVYDTSFANSSEGFAVAMRSPILVNFQAVSGAESGQEQLLGQSLSSSRNIPGKFSPIASLGSPVNGGTQMAKGISESDFGFVSVGGDNPLCAAQSAIPSRLNASRDASTGDISFSVEAQGAVIPLGIAVYFPNHDLVPINFTLAGVISQHCTIPFLFSLVGTAPSMFTLPVTSIVGIRAYAIGLVVEISSGKILTTNAVSFSGDFRPY